MPIQLIDKLILDTIKLNFLPIIYLHNYEADFFAKPIIEKNIFKIKLKTNDYLRRLGRSTVENKLIYLSKKYSFQSLIILLENNNLIYIYVFKKYCGI